MQRNLCVMPVILTILWSISSVSATPIELYTQPLADQYQRIELVVPDDFTASCETQDRPTGKEGVCKISGYRSEFINIFKADFKQGIKVDLSQADRAGIIRFSFTNPKTLIQSKMLKGPPRWVIEMGEPDTLLGPIEDELLFRPYPIATRTIKLAPPSIVVAQMPDGLDPEIKVFNAAWNLFENKKFQESLNKVSEIKLDTNLNRPTALHARRLIAENWVEISQKDPKFDLDKAILALENATAAAGDDREKARYVILSSDLRIRKGKIDEAEKFLTENRRHYSKTDAEPYILAELARILLEQKDEKEAQNLLSQLQAIDSQYEEVSGARLIALASLAYAKQDYATAITLFDEAKIRFPELLTQEPTPLFQIAELYFRAERLAEAKVFYEEFLSRFPDKIPNWIVRIRLAQIKSFSQPKEALQDMTQLSSQLPEPEGQDLAKLYALNLKSDPTGPDPALVLKEVGAHPLTDYVMLEHRLQGARYALQEGRLANAFQFAKEIWTTFPEHSILREAPLLFDRILLMEAERLLRTEKFEDLILSYFKNKSRFRSSRKRALLHLMVAKAMRLISMHEEASVEVIEKGGIQGTVDDEVKALLHLELVGILREMIEDVDPDPKDVNHFKKAFEYLEKAMPGKFNHYEYLLSKGYYSFLQGQLTQAKDIYLYALNSANMKPLERLHLAKQIIEIYLKLPNYEKAISALEVSLDIYKEFEKEINAPGLKSDLLWRLVELNIMSKKWDDVVPSIKDYLEESQSVMTRLSKTAQEIEYARRHEALFYMGYALHQLSDKVGARRRWDLLSKEAPFDVYGKMAEDELFLLTWNELVYPKILKKLGR